MNAQEQAIGVNQATKIAGIVTLFKQEFPDVRVDLKPWCNDLQTQQWADPDSIDLGFHLPGWSPRFQSRSMLVQIRFHHDWTQENSPSRLIGIDILGFNHSGQTWRFSTIDSWQCLGEKTPAPEIVDRLKRFSRHIFELFNSPPSDHNGYPPV